MTSFRHLFRIIGLSLLLALAAQQATAQDDDPGLAVPPRIGMVSGQASFWRPGAEDWVPAQVNMPLAAGDAVYTAENATLELQVGSRAYVRLAQNAMLTLLDDDRDVQQFKLSSGIVAFDLREMAGRSIEIDTPDGAFTIDKAGYYRVEIADGATRFTVRRGGEAIATLADGNTRRIAPSQEAVVEAADGARDIDTYVAPDLDSWDEWNLARSDDLIDAISNRYVPDDVYGVDDLDRYGDWRTTPDYGPVWVPSGVGDGWAPYSAGSWVWDPVYSWTWVDTAPWGWAPYHYGRWVHVGGYWAWAPGPRHVRAVYAPALVAFFHSGGTSISISSGPAVSWVALGWGEPCVPWWGRSNFAGRPWWGGWGGPRVVNNVVVQRNTVINNITINKTSYRNLQQRNALIAVPEKQFGHGRLHNERRFTGMRDNNNFEPIGGRHPVRPAPASLVPTAARGVAPTPNVLGRSAVAVREPRELGATPWRNGRRDERNDATNNARSGASERSPNPNAPQNRIVRVKPNAEQQIPPARFGNRGGEERRPSRQLQDPPQIGRQGEAQRRSDDTRDDTRRGQIQRDANDSRFERNGQDRRSAGPSPQWRDDARRPGPGVGRLDASPPADAPRGLERAETRPAMPSAVPQRQQQPMRIEPVPQRQEQPARIEPVPQRGSAWQHEAPQMPAPVAPRREIQRQEVPRQEAPRGWSNRASDQGAMSVAPQRPQQQEMRREMRRQDAPLPGQPANQMYRGQGNRQEFGR